MSTTSSTTRLMTLEDVINIIRREIEFSKTRQRDLISAANTMARLLNRNAAEVPADMSSLRQKLSNIHHVQAGMSSKRFANIKSDLAAAIHHARERQPRRSIVTPLPEWTEFLSLIEQKWQRYSLSRLIQFCSQLKIMPQDVDDEVIKRFQTYLASTILAKDPDKIIKITTQTWNGVKKHQSSNLQELTIPSSGRYTTPHLSTYPQSFQDDIEKWVSRLTQDGMWIEDGPSKPLKPVTILNIRAQIRQFAAALIAQGKKKGDITDLSVFVELENYKNGLRFFVNRNDGKPQSWLAGMAATLLAIARYHVRVAPDKINQLKTIKGRLTIENLGMTDKNKERLAQFDVPGNVSLLFELPRQILKQAQRKKHILRNTALNVMRAVAIEILLTCPMRSGNLANLNIEKHFLWCGQGNSQKLSIVISGTETKNAQPIEVGLPKETMRLIKTYLKEYRPLISDVSGDWLFPCRSGGPRLPSDLSTDMTRLIYRETGLRFNAHLFRHFAGMMYLKHVPGDFETVRRILGHKKMMTTLNFYTSMSDKWALQQYDKVVLSGRGKND